MKILLSFSILISILYGCTDIEMRPVPITVILSNPMPGLKADDALPSYLIKLINPIEGNDTNYIPQLTIKRLDLPEESPFKIEVPSTTENQMRKLGNTYDYDNLKDDYSENLPTIKAGTYLTKEGSTMLSSYSVSDGSDALVYNLNTEEKNSADSILKIYSSILKINGGGKIVVILKTSNTSQTIPVPPDGIGQTTTNNFDTFISLPNEEALRQELLKIIDTKKKRKEREEIAEAVWKDYFFSDVYVDNLMDLDDKNPQHWSPGNGKSYLAHLVTLPSIVDIKILAVERDKVTQKISGLTVCEKHNGSKIDRKIISPL